MPALQPVDWFPFFSSNKAFAVFYTQLILNCNKAPDLGVWRHNQYLLQCDSDAAAMWLRCDCDADGGYAQNRIFFLQSLCDRMEGCCAVFLESSILQVIRFFDTNISTNAMWFSGLQLHCKGSENLVSWQQLRFARTYLIQHCIVFCCIFVLTSFQHI